MVDMSKMRILHYFDTENWNRMEMAHKGLLALVELKLVMEL
jgi:hypothetical protein